MADPVRGRTELDLDVQWVHGAGSKDATEVAAAGPPVQVHALNDHTWVLRQNKTVHFEGPFLYLLAGEKRAVLLDTGATSDADAFPLRAAVDHVLDTWLARHPRDGYELVVAHTHAHADHVAGDEQFRDRPRTTVVGKELGDVRRFFGFTSWPTEVVLFDLGDRVLELTGIPGHHETSVAVFDPWTRLLLTGDTVYPGRLYVRDLDAFSDSLTRLVEMARARSVSYLMGCHIELARDGREYPMGTRYQPDEPPIHQPVEVLERVAAAARSTDGRTGVHAGDGFLLVDLRGVGTVKLMAHNLRLRRRHA